MSVLANGALCGDEKCGFVGIRGWLWEVGGNGTEFKTRISEGCGICNLIEEGYEEGAYQEKEACGKGAEECF